MMENTKDHLNILEQAADIPSLAARHHLTRVRRWSSLAPLSPQDIEKFFYQLLGGAASSPLELFHPNIRKKLTEADPASISIYECVGTQEAIAQCLSALPDISSVSVVLAQTRYSELADWELMMSDDIETLAKTLAAPATLCLSTVGAPLPALQPRELCVYLLTASSPSSAAL